MMDGKNNQNAGYAVDGVPNAGMGMQPMQGYPAMAGQMQAPIPGMMQMPMQPMVMMTHELAQAKQDLRDLKDLKEHSDSQVVLCPMCDQRSSTDVKKTNSQVQYAICLGVTCAGCWLGCCLIPFCIDGIADHTHYCSKCKHPLGRNGIKMC